MPTSFIVAVVAIILHVANYNFTAQLEYKTRVFTNLLGRNAVYYYTAYLIASALIRDHLIQQCLQQDNGSLGLHVGPFNSVDMFTFGSALILFGMGLNLWTLKALGIKGMYNGDSFGWLMSEPVISGPFKYFNDPQYFGTSVAMFGSAIAYRSRLGLALTILMYLVFSISVRFVEGPHMLKIYSNRAKSSLYSSSSDKIAASVDNPGTRSSPRRRQRVKHE